MGRSKLRESEALTAALRYAARGWRVFPVHSMGAGRCSCGKVVCPSPGKHPRTPNGVKDATTDPATVRQWWQQWPTANVAIATGAGLMVLDIDPDKGGDESLEDLQRVGRLPETLEVMTGGGGRHYYLETREAVSNSASKLGPGLDIRGAGGYVVAPPSNHASGGRYEWEGLTDGVGALGVAPGWLVDLCTARPDTVVHFSRAEQWAEGSRNTMITQWGGLLRRHGVTAEEMPELLGVLNYSRCKGQPLGRAEVEQIAASVSRYDVSDPLLQVRDFAGAMRTNPDDEWKQALLMVQDRQGNQHLAKTAGNVAVLFIHHPDLAGCLVTDGFDGDARWLWQPPGIPGAGELTPEVGPLRDSDIVYAQQYVAHTDGALMSAEVVWSGLKRAAEARRVHPVRDWLNGLEWDGVERVPGWLSSYLGAERTEYSDRVGQAWLVSAIARIMRPGCQADHVLVLEGGQGAGKSSAMRLLFGADWFLDCLPDIRQKDALQVMRGKWGIEVAELDSFRGAAETRIKSFITQRVDEYRPAYARQVERFARQCVIVGTTNESSWLTDSTGGRRFWPVKVGTIGRKKLARDRAQIWAEAKRLFDGGAAWWLEQGDEDAARDEQEGRYSVDVWEDLIDNKAHDVVLAHDLFEHILGIEIGKVTKSDQARVGAIMRRLGYKKERVRFNGARTTTYTRET